MKQKIKYLAAGVLIGATVVATAGAFAYTDYIEAVYNNIKIVVNGKEIHPNSEPFISNGTTYLPVRAVAEALGQPVDWDGPNHTVYIGSMNGNLNSPSLLMTDANNIGDNFYTVRSDQLTDNYGNSYSFAFKHNDSFGGTYETLLNMKYKRFKATLYVPQDCNTSDTAKVIVKTDGKIVYTSPEITKSSRPIDLDIDVTGCNDFEIEVNRGFEFLFIGDGGFYQ